jgi:hypothetical protein
VLATQALPQLIEQAGVLPKRISETMQITQLLINPILTFILGLVVTSIFFYIKRSNEKIDKRQKAGAKFLAKVNECLVDVRLKGNAGSQCICFESHAEFRLTLSGKKATEFDQCWDDYILQRETNGTRCIECIECLHRIIHEVTNSKADARVEGCISCGA